MFRSAITQKIFCGHRGFTLIEVMVAASLMIILAVGVLSVFSYAVKLNAGNTLRAQAFTVLQKEEEKYRALRFVPPIGATILSDPPLNQHVEQKVETLLSQDQESFDLYVTITNIEPTLGSADETAVTLKRIDIEARPTVARQGWLADLKTKVTVLRVRSN